mgnify:CR=1 FL=1
METRDTREFILVRPLTMKVRPTSSWVGIDVSITRERDTLCPALDELLVALSRPQVIPLYTRAASCGLQSPSRLINSVRLGD